MPDSHLIVFNSAYSVKESLDRLESVLQEKKVKVFARFNHAQEASEVGLVLEDVEVLVFGDPEVGTFLMQEDIRIAIALPLKVLAWQSASGTKLAYEDPAIVAKFYDIIKHQSIVTKMQAFMDAIIKTVISGDKND